MTITSHRSIGRHYSPDSTELWSNQSNWCHPSARSIVLENNRHSVDNRCYRNCRGEKKDDFVNSETSNLLLIHFRFRDKQRNITSVSANTKLIHPQQTIHTHRHTQYRFNGIPLTKSSYSRAPFRFYYFIQFSKRFIRREFSVALQSVYNHFFCLSLTDFSNFGLSLRMQRLTQRQFGFGLPVRCEWCHRTLCGVVNINCILRTVCLQLRITVRWTGTIRKRELTEFNWFRNQSNHVIN